MLIIQLVVRLYTLHVVYLILMLPNKSILGPFDYGFVKSRLGKLKSKLGTQLLPDFCEKVDFTRL